MFTKGRILTERRGELSEFDALFAHSHAGVFVVRDGQFQYVNAQFEKDTGFSRAELIGTDCLRLVLPEDRPKVRENAIRMLKGAQSLPYQYQIITKAGVVKWVLESVSSITHEESRATLGMFLETTAFKQAQEGERSRTQQLGLLFAIARSLARPGGFQDRAARVLELLLITGNASHAVLRVHDAREAGLRLVAQAGSAAAGPEVVPLASLESLSAIGFQTGEPLIRDAAPDAAAQGVESLAVIPLIGLGHTLGVLEVSARQPNHFTAERVRLLSAVADSIQPFLEGSRVQEELNLKNGELEQLLKQIGSTNNQLEVLNQIVQRQLNGLFGTVTELIDAERKELEEIALVAPSPVTERFSRFLARLQSAITQTQ